MPPSKKTKKNNMPNNKNVTLETKTTVKIKEKIMIAVMLAAGAVVLAGLVAMIIIPTKSEKKPTTNTTIAIAPTQTEKVLQLNEKYKKAALADQPGILQQMLSTAQERKRFLLQLADENNIKFSEHTLNQLQYNSFPPTVQEFLEIPKTVQQQSIVAITSDDFENQIHKTKLYFASESSDEIYGDEIRLIGASSPPLMSGTTFTGTGVIIDNTWYATELSEITEPLTQRIGEARTIVILAHFNNQTPDRTPEYYTNFYFGSDEEGINTFYKENSYDRVWVNGDLEGWFTIDKPTTACNSNTWYYDVVQNPEIDAVVDWTQYDHFVWVTPTTSACGSSSSSVGYTTFTSPDGPVEMSMTRVFTDNSFVHTHEFGHALGVSHANHLDCAPDRIDPHFWECTNVRYGNHYDVMGLGLARYHLGAPLKELLGWFEPGEVVTIDAPGTYNVTIGNLEDASTATKAVKIVRYRFDDGDPANLFYLEKRSGTGFDDGLQNYVHTDLGRYVVDGALMNFRLEEWLWWWTHGYDEWDYNGGSWLINNNYLELYTSKRAALLVNDTFTDISDPNFTNDILQEISITTTNVTDTAVDVEIVIQDICQDRTPLGECSEKTIGLRCTMSGKLTESCFICGCPPNHICRKGAPAGTCFPDPEVPESAL